MRSLLKVCLSIFIIAVIFFNANILYCDDANRELKTFRGTVTEIDWVGSLLTVSGGDELTFSVPSSAQIINGVEKVALASIEQSDAVLIKYYDDPSGTHTAVSINIESAYPSF